MTRLPHTTANISLAIVHHIAGAPIEGMWRIFTPEDLKRLGFRTIEEAHAKRAQGRIRITNTHTKERAEVEATFDRASRDEAVEIPDLYVKVGDDYRRANEKEFAAVIATVTLKTRSQVIDALSKPSAYILDIAEGEPLVDTSNPLRTVIHFPAHRLISANASEATKARLLP